MLNDKWNASKRRDKIKYSLRRPTIKYSKTEREQTGLRKKRKKFEMNLTHAQNCQGGKNMKILGEQKMRQKKMGKQRRIKKKQLQKIHKFL